MQKRQVYALFFKYIFQLTTVDENTEPVDFEGLYHVYPRNNKFGEDNIVSKLKGCVPTNILQGLIRSLFKNYPPDRVDYSKNIRKDLIAKSSCQPGDLAWHSLAIAKTVRQSLTLVFVHAVNESEVLVSEMECIPKENNRWFLKDNRCLWQSLSSLVVTNVPAEVDSSGPCIEYILSNSLKSILKLAGVKI